MSDPIILLGPTAVGKSALALEWAEQKRPEQKQPPEQEQSAEQKPMEIISVDSAMIYRGMDIGTAKPSPEILKKIPHHLIDILDPSETYSVANFCRDALEKITDIQKRNKTPLLVGGTMLYFNALLKGLSHLPSANPNIRAQLAAEAKQKSWPALHERLMKIDPESAKRISSQDAQRIQRALEIYELTGESMSEWQRKHPPKSFLNPHQIRLVMMIPKDRTILHERIERRFDEMLKAGFIEEVEKLFKRGDLHANLPSMRSVGYRQAWEYLEGKMDFETMREKSIIATRQLAKRQMTWLRAIEKTWQDKITIERIE